VRGCPAARSSWTGRAGARDVAAGAGDSIASPTCSRTRGAGVLHNPKSDRRRPRACSHRRGRLPVPADKIALPKQAFATLLERARPAGKRPGAALHGGPERAGADVRFAAAAPIVCPDGQRAGEEHGDSVLAPASLVSNLDFVEPSSATVAIRICPKTMPRSSAALTGHTAASSWRRTSWASQEDLGLRTSARRPSASGATACAGRKKTNLQRRQAL